MKLWFNMKNLIKRWEEALNTATASDLTLEALTLDFPQMDQRMERNLSRSCNSSR
jgi:hypothetical protein